MQRAGELESRLQHSLEEQNFPAVWTKLQSNHQSRQQFIRSVHGWFDGLKTRQLLTTLTSPQAQTDQDIVNQLFRWGGFPELETEAQQLQQLEQLQGVSRPLLDSFLAE